MSLMQLKGKKIIYAGCSRGIGYQVVQVLVEEGADVVGFARRMPEEKIKTVQEAGEGSFTFMKCDVSNREMVNKCVDEAVKILGGRLDVVISGALRYWAVKCEELTDEDFEELFSIVFYGTVHLNQAAFPYLKESEGTIINFGSGAGITTKTAGPDPAHYCAGKAAVHMWTKCVAKEWAQYNINANVVCPMMWTEAGEENINTPEMMEWYQARLKEHIFMGRNGDARTEMAPYIVFLCTKGAKFITGQLLNCDGGMVESR